jgi:hypothetical protein
MPLRYYPRGFRVIALRAISGLKPHSDTVPALVEILQISEEPGDLGRADQAFQPDAVFWELFTPAIVLCAICEQHARDSAVFDIVGARYGNPDLHSGAVGRQC